MCTRVCVYIIKVVLLSINYEYFSFFVGCPVFTWEIGNSYRLAAIIFKIMLFICKISKTKINKKTTGKYNTSRVLFFYTEILKFATSINQSYDTKIVFFFLVFELNICLLTHFKLFKILHILIIIFLTSINLRYPINYLQFLNLYLTRHSYSQLCHVQILLLNHKMTSKWKYRRKCTYRAFLL